MEINDLFRRAYNIVISSFIIAAIINVGVILYHLPRGVREEKELKKIMAEKGYTIQKVDLNGNGVAEEFYEIGGKKCFVAVDGRNLEELLISELLKRESSTANFKLGIKLPGYELEATTMMKY